MPVYLFAAKGFQGQQNLDVIIRAYLQNRYASSPEQQDQISRSRVRRLIVARMVRVDGKIEGRPATALAAGCRVEITFDEAAFFYSKDPGDIEFNMDSSRILYEDQWLVVVNKPAGLPTEATVVEGRPNLHQAVAAYLASPGLPQVPGDADSADSSGVPYLGLHHRLDRETSGVILFSKSRDANPGLHQAFLERRVCKTYSALCALPSSGLPRELSHGRTLRIHNHLGRTSPKSQACKWGALPTGDPAETDLVVEKILKGGVLITARPHTGRTHQIRIHCADAGLPLMGDTLYGGPSRCASRQVPRVMLHASRLEFQHPLTGQALSIAAPLPPDFLECMDWMS